ncbi:DUF4123 domain-containing protein [Vibrio aquaticus]|uniref:DUF4123 domain-containing protein n=1 Tax=Vibrio aquaticus TaxID=2496559 RepID=A0A432D1Y7_9VIBR|nr:DUF4123 domain-containing protein [Vibrio aquaticus]RTZ17954.1 DUF4123 domain-containing protein [Vibrio aquaticus]
MKPRFELGKGEQLFLLVEGANVPDLACQLYQLPGELEQEPIFLHPPYDDLLHISPRVVVATKDVQQWFLELNQYQSGYFFSSNLSLSHVSESLRRLIVAEMPEGNKGFLRFFDSNVAAILLETHCAALWYPMNRVWLARSGEWQILESPFEASPELTNDPIKIAEEQWRRMKMIPWLSALPDRVIHHLQSWFPESISTVNDLRQWVCQHMDLAYAQGFKTEQDLLYYFNVLGYLGEDAFSNHAYPELTPFFETTSSDSPSDRIAHAAKLAEHIANRQRNC